MTYLVKRNGLMYQPERVNDLLGMRNMKIFRRNGTPRMRKIDKVLALTDDDREALVNAANLRRAAVQPTPSNMKLVEWDETLGKPKKFIRRSILKIQSKNLFLNSISK